MLFNNVVYNLGVKGGKVYGLTYANPTDPRLYERDNNWPFFGKFKGVLNGVLSLVKPRGIITILSTDDTPRYRRSTGSELKEMYPMLFRDFREYHHRNVFQRIQ